MTLQKIEVPVPDGWKVVGYRGPKAGECVLDSGGAITMEYGTSAPWLILEREVAYRTPTAADANTTIHVRQREDLDWVRGCHFVGLDEGGFVTRWSGGYRQWPFARILDDNPPKVPPPTDVLDALRKLNDSSEKIYALTPDRIFSGGLDREIWDVIEIVTAHGVSRDECALKAIEQAMESSHVSK